MSKDLPVGRSWPNPPDLDLIASQTRLIIRNSCKFTATGFFQSLLCSSAFLMTVLGDLMQQRYSTAATAIGTSGIQRILIEDASSQVMPKSNADEFPAHGNHYGKTAGVKIDLAYDLLTGSIVSHGLHAATEQDKTIGKEFVIEVRRGDLILRDMGYFSLSEFTAIEKLEAWWLTRLPLTTGAVLADGRTLKKLFKSFKGDIIDIEAIVGKQGKKYRLVAMGSDPKVSAARRDLPRPLGGGNSIPRMEAGAQPRQSPQSQEQRTSSTSPSAGRDDRPPAWHEDGPADRKHSRTGKTEL